MSEETQEQEVVEETEEFTDEIPDDISLFGEEEAPAQEEPDKAPPKKPPVEEGKPPQVEQKETKAEDKPKEDAVPESLQKMQQRIEQQDRELRQREDSVKQAERWQRQAEAFERFQADLHKDPVGTMQRAGVNVGDHFAEQLGLKEPKPEVETLKERIERLESERAQEQRLRAKAEDEGRVQAAQQRVFKRYEGIAGAGPQTDEEWESLEKSPNPHVAAFADVGAATIWNQAQTYAQATSKWLPDDEATRRAEAQLAAEVGRVLEVAKKMPQYRHEFGKPTSGDSQDAKSPAKTSQTAPGKKKTLSQRDTSTPPPAGQPDDLIDADDEDILAAGLAAFQGALEES